MSKRKSQADIFHFFKKKTSTDDIPTNIQNEKEYVNTNGSMKSNEILPKAKNPTETFIATEIQPDEYDIGNFIGKSEKIADELKYRIVSNTWIPPATYEFPIVMQSGNKRQFQRSWLTEFSWLSYSAKHAGAYCKICVLFGAKEGGKSKISLGSFVLSPFHNYKKGKESLRGHALKEYHKIATINFTDFIRTFENPTESIDVKINTEMKRRIEENRLRLLPIIKTIIFCGKQNISLRGHRDDGNLTEEDGSGSIANEGNFRSLLRFRIDAGDTVLKNHINNAPRNATFISKTTQNELIDICGELILQKILNSVKESLFFSILADETTDVGAIEQMSLSIRYWDITKKKIREDFVGFVEARGLSGKFLAHLIEENLKKLGLKIENMRGQGYDGSSNMAGKFKGVQARIKEKQALAIYMHCASHKLNLAISKACSLRSIRNAVGVMKEVINAVRESAKRMNWMREEIQEHHPQEMRLKFSKLCETRWIERHDAILQFLQVFDAIVCFLELLDAEESSSKSASLIASVLRFDFLIAVHIISSILSLTISLSRNLQSPSLDLKQCYDMVKHVVDTLNDYRISSSSYSKIYDEASKVATKHSIEITMPRIVRTQHHRSNTAASSPEEYYKLNLFLPFIDFIISELVTRFSAAEHSNIVVLHGLIPAFANEDTETLMNAAEPYKKDIPGTFSELRAEIDLWQRQWKNKPESELPRSASESILHASEFYPNIKTLLHILCILPVTTCTSERSFSTLRRVKTYLRSNMKEERLNGLALLNIHHDKEIHPEEVLNKFAMKHHRKLQL